IRGRIAIAEQRQGHEARAFLRRSVDHVWKNFHGARSCASRDGPIGSHDGVRAREFTGAPRRRRP
ncbi:MAG: hypothetical protein ACJ79L_21055, partial [Anaeromyxobacteraceae bacterium]